jgi:ribonuclease BN (tRNA processing enzyme)
LTNQFNEPVRLRFLGAGNAFGSGGRFQACILVTSPAGAFLIDCGASSLIAMKRYDVDPSEIQAVLVSHLHGDHFGGLPYFILDAQFSHRTRPLIVAGPVGIEERTRQLMEALFPGSSEAPRQFTVRFTELTPRRALELGVASAEAFEARHPSGAPALSLRVRIQDKVIGYSGDTAWTDELAKAANLADAFICEAYFYDKKVPHHLDFSTLMAHKEALTCKRLILIHMSADMLAHVGEIQEANILYAQDGWEVPI